MSPRAKVAIVSQKASFFEGNQALVSWAAKLEDPRNCLNCRELPSLLALF